MDRQSGKNGSGDGFLPESGGERAAGLCLMVVTVLLFFWLPWGILKAAARIHPWLAFVLEVFWMYQILAMKSLRTESMKVFDALMQKDITRARQMLSWLVGRDTEHLSEAEVIKADVETIAENTTDGVTAPMIFMAIGGAPLGFAYKAVNTLDSMVGYRNEKYRYLGTASARMDDIFNFVPARISGILMVLSAFLLKYDGRNAWQCFLRDRNKHLSPNSAQTESACGGLWGFSLAEPMTILGKQWKSRRLARKTAAGTGRYPACQPSDAVDVLLMSGRDGTGDIYCRIFILGGEVLARTEKKDYCGKSTDEKNTSDD